MAQPVTWQGSHVAHDPESSPRSPGRPAPGQGEAFRFDQVSVRRGDRLALADVSASVRSSCITAIAGPSGAGKTTLLRLCDRLEVPSSGHVYYRGTDVAALEPLALRREVGMVFQRPVMLPGTVRDNLAVAAPRASDETFRDALRRVALDEELLDRPGTELSGGEAQRACLARTLVTRPAVLLLDEPTSALDAVPRRAFEDLCLGLARDGMTILWVTHDLDQLTRVGEDVVILAEGRVRFTGRPQDALGDPATAALLTGEALDDAR